MTRPTCINLGCNKKAQNKNGNTNKNGSPKAQKWRTTCYECHNAAMGLSSYAPGVVAVKEHRCANIDGKGRLSNGKTMGDYGFKCPVDWDNVPDDFPGIFEIDHINGDHLDNREINRQPLCCLCHRVKTPMNGDNRKDDMSTEEAEKISNQKKINIAEQKIAKANFYKNREHFKTLFK